MPRFTVKDLLIATTFIAMGAGLMVVLVQNRKALMNAEMGGTCVLLWFGGGACIGAGFGTPFKQAQFGAIVALFLQLLAPFVLALAIS